MYLRIHLFEKCVHFSWEVRSMGCRVLACCASLAPRECSALGDAAAVFRNGASLVGVRVLLAVLH